MNEYTNPQGYELDWDSEIEQESRTYITLPEGTYPFRVESFERGLYDGGSKIPKCKMATLNIRLDGGELGIASVTERLYLHSTMEWKLSEFFAAIGLKRKGERVTMNWNAVPGAVGMAEVEVNTYTNKEGKERKNNRVTKFLPAEEGEPKQAVMDGFQPRTRMAEAAYQPGKF